MNKNLTPILLTLFFFGVVKGEIISLALSGIITESLGMPLGMHIEVGQTIDGFLDYDTKTLPRNQTATNSTSFNVTIPNGFRLFISGQVLTSSSYILQNINHVENFGGSDLFHAVTGTGSLFIDGAQTNGFIQLMFIDTDQSLFANDVSLSQLVDLRNSQAIDGLFGFLGADDHNYALMASRQYIQNGISIGGIPEPSTLTLFSLGLILFFGLTFRKKRN
jgi:hypothetical protein